MTSKITEISLGKLKGYKLSVGKSYVQVISDVGCNVNKLVLFGQDIIDGYDSDDILLSNKGAKSVIAVPFPNRVDDAKYTFEKKKHQLEINRPKEGKPIHGLLYNKKYELVKKQILDNMITATFSHEIKKTDFAGYPFHIVVSLTFVLEENKMTIMVNTTNKDNCNVPYGVCWHPYFKFDKKLEDYAILIPSTTLLEMKKDKINIPTGEVYKNKNLPTFDLVGDAVFDNCFTNLTNTESYVENVTIFWDKSIDFLQVYTHDDRKSIAIEPMSCASNAFNNNMGLKILKPGETFSNFFGVRID
jgi:aldose 1-epimerase